MPRPRAKPIKVWVTDDERATITSLAASANLSLSAYLRAAGLNQKVRSVLDVHAVEELSKVHGSLGKISKHIKDENLIKEIHDLQTKLHELMGRMTR